MREGFKALILPHKAPVISHFNHMGDPMILPHKAASGFEGRPNHFAPGCALEAAHHKTIYNSKFTVSDIFGTWKRYEPKALHDEVMICYGYGDGGGGPTRDMVLRGIRMERGIPGAPKLRMEGLRPYLDRLGAKMDARADEFPIWNGELYLQYHRGTLTSVGKNNANNRNAERVMRELEFVATLAQVTKEMAYPKAEIRALWDIVLVNQFHDILPGTSIAEVYEDSDAEYARLFEAMHIDDGPMQSALNAVCPMGEGDAKLVNFTGQARGCELVVIPGEGDLSGLVLSTCAGKAELQEVFAPDGSTQFVAPVDGIPALGWSVARLGISESVIASSLSVSKLYLENDRIAVRFDEAGEIFSVFDKELGRELIQEGRRANQMIAYEDKPKAYDAWDIDHYFEEKSWQLSDEPAHIDVLETGPHRAALRIERRYAASRIVQIVSLQEGKKQVEFDTEVDWQERQMLLKTGFPLDLNVSETRAEIQFGHVKRASHKNTSWDQAQFETNMHRWVDMSEPDFGAALLTDCKYGYDAVEQTLRLTLLKGPTSPAPNADLGLHRFRYALLLHEGEQDLAQVVRTAERFNNPIMVHGAIPRDMCGDHVSFESFSFASSNNENLTLETVKIAEAGGDVILRVFEHANRRCRGTICFGLQVDRVEEADLMERTEGAVLAIADNAIELSFLPFEIKTLKIVFKKTEGKVGFCQNKPPCPAAL